MALELIGAGFGRTGTASMKMALELLGLGPCHHMKEVIANPEQKRIWRAVSAGEHADWDEAFSGYRSSVDWPSAFFWRELAAHYPDAKILLTVRSPESWYASMEKTINKVLASSTEPESVGVALISKRVFDGRFDDRDHAIAVYEKNTADVQSAFGDSRLLTHQLGDGWEPLCRFLDLPVPRVPYPRTNSSAEFNSVSGEPQNSDER